MVPGMHSPQPSSVMPLQLSSIELRQISVTGTTCPVHVVLYMRVVPHTWVPLDDARTKRGRRDRGRDAGFVTRVPDRHAVAFTEHRNCAEVQL